MLSVLSPWITKIIAAHTTNKLCTLHGRVCKDVLHGCTAIKPLVRHSASAALSEAAFHPSLQLHLGAQRLEGVGALDLRAGPHVRDCKHFLRFGKPKRYCGGLRQSTAHMTTKRCDSALCFDNEADANIACPVIACAKPAPSKKGYFFTSLLELKRNQLGFRLRRPRLAGGRQDLSSHRALAFSDVYRCIPLWLYHWLSLWPSNQLIQFVGRIHRWSFKCQRVNVWRCLCVCCCCCDSKSRHSLPGFCFTRPRRRWNRNRGGLSVRSPRGRCFVVARSCRGSQLRRQRAQLRKPARRSCERGGHRLRLGQRRLLRRRRCRRWNARRFRRRLLAV
mmetsp:Transcript_72181/g.167267  ORF Transcript_72181/g.167267 Transcript_72181/m.167267 type:complete len:334 (+) Transcript_72181:210-1211(+)